MSGAGNPGGPILRKPMQAGNPRPHHSEGLGAQGPHAVVESSADRSSSDDTHLKQEHTMSYIDGMVCAVPTADKDAYVQYAREFGALFKKHGALAVVDGWGDDVPEGKLTSFPMAVKREPHETVVFSWVQWPSREVRDAAWKALENEPLMKPGANPMPFDGKRMIYGGFSVIAQS